MGCKCGRQTPARPTMHAVKEASLIHSPERCALLDGRMAGKAFFSARKHAILFASADAAGRAMAMIEIGSNFLKERRSERVREGTEEGGKGKHTNVPTATQAHPKAGTPTPPNQR